MKDKRILLTKDIQDIYTKVVNTYLLRGYSIHVNSMSGCFSNEIARVDVTDGKDIYRITLNSGYKSEYTKNIYYYIQTITLITEKFENKASAVKMGEHSTIWSGKGIVVCSKTWFGVGDKGKAWTDSLKYAVDCYNKACERSKIENISKNYYGATEKEMNLSDATRAKVADICRRTKGYMRIKDNDVDRFVITTYAGSGRKLYTVYFTPNSRKNRLLVGTTDRKEYR